MAYNAQDDRSRRYLAFLKRLSTFAVGTAEDNQNIRARASLIQAFVGKWLYKQEFLSTLFELDKQYTGQRFVTMDIEFLDTMLHIFTCDKQWSRDMCKHELQHVRVINAFEPLPSEPKPGVYYGVLVLNDSSIFPWVGIRHKNDKQPSAGVASQVNLMRLWSEETIRRFYVYLAEQTPPEDRSPADKILLADIV